MQCIWHRVQALYVAWICCFQPQLSAVHHARIGGNVSLQTLARAQVAGLGNSAKQVLVYSVDVHHLNALSKI